MATSEVSVDVILALTEHQATTIWHMSCLSKSRPLPPSSPDYEVGLGDMNSDSTDPAPAAATLHLQSIGTHLRAHHTTHPSIRSEPSTPASIGSLAAAKKHTNKRVHKQHPPCKTKKVSTIVVSKK
jgi:hypothetical protein